MQFNIILLASMFSCWTCFLKFLFWMLGAFLLGLLLGYILWQKYKELVEDFERQNANLRAKVTDMEKDNASLRYSVDETEKELAASKASLRTCKSDKAVLKGKISQLERNIENLNTSTVETANNPEGSDNTALGFVTGAVTKEALKEDNIVGGINYGGMFQDNNLQIVEGIGPKIEALLKDNNINTWAGLSACPIDGLKKILTDAGSRFRIHNPKTWPEQAKLAHNGQWKELLEYQKFLDTGRETTGDFNSPAKIEKLATKILGFTNKPDDLKIVEGIGPKIEALLKTENINNWSDLAKTEVGILETILTKAGDRFRLANPGTWPKQAALAVEQKWAELKEYQDFLQGGNDPTR